MPRRFVILTHDHPFLHWDLLVEDGDELRSWRLLVRPDATLKTISAETLPPHRTIYLDYEGPVSGNRGSVSQFDAGECEITTDSKDRIELLLQGAHLRGRFLVTTAEAGRCELVRVEEESSG